MITAEEITKHQKNGNVHHYRYYHCTKRKNNCTQGSITEKELEKQIVQVLDSIEIQPDFHEWAMKQLRLENEKESENRSRILENQQKTYNECLKKLDTLIDMRTGGEITEEEFARKKNEFTKEKIRLEKLLKDTGDRVNKWLEMAEDVFRFASEAKKKI